MSPDDPIQSPSEYEPEDSHMDNGLECCAGCELQLTGEAGHHGEIYTQAGTRYDHALDSDPGEAPFFCPDCWFEATVKRRKEENMALEDFA